MKFLVDNQLPAALARFLSSAGHPSLHVLDVTLDEAQDDRIFEYALREDMILISKDEDFVFLVNSRSPAPPLIWVRLPNCRKSTLLQQFGSALSSMIHELSQGSTIVELR